jgi:hypothetical protein
MPFAAAQHRMALLLRLVIDLRPIVAGIEHSHSPNTVDQE